MFDPVSYTHLDVYKRQAVPRWFSQQNEEDEEEIIEAYYKYRDEPVSYTHLDVYKRQSMN